MIKIDERVCRPQLFLDFFATDDLPLLFKQHHQDFERLRLEADFEPLLAQFAIAKIYLEHAKSESSRNARGLSA